MKIKRGDVFYCQGSPDAIGSEEQSTRPVVIVQNDVGNANSPTVIVANITTRTGKRIYPMQFDIILPGRSVSRVMCEQIRTVDKSRLQEKIYSLNPDEMVQLDRCLSVSLGLSNTAQDAAERYKMGMADIFHYVTGKGLYMAVWAKPQTQIVEPEINADAETDVDNMADLISRAIGKSESN